MRLYLFALLICAANAFSGVMPDKSRIIYRENSHMETTMLVNTNRYPVMVQLWVDEGDLKTVPEKASAPFVVTPAMFKLSPMQLNGIKVIFSGDRRALPTDRESLYWLNIYEVPPAPTSKPNEEKIALSMLTQVKVLYRPKLIDIDSQEVIKKLAKLSFKLDTTKPDAFALTVHNPTPYVASLSALKLTGKQGAQSISIDPEPEIDLLILPMSSQTFYFNKSKLAQTLTEPNVIYTLVDDSGRYLTVQRKL